MSGTASVISQADKKFIKGFVINKFRGDPELFEDGYRLIAEQTGWRGFGVIPWFADAHRLPAEDALDISGTAGHGTFHIVCLMLSRIANFDDLDPLKLEPGVRITMLRP